MKWKEKSTLSKVTSVTVILCSALIILFALLQLCGVWENAISACMPLMCVNLLIYTVTNWKTNRGIAVFNLIAALFILLCIILVVFVK